MKNKSTKTDSIFHNINLILKGLWSTSLLHVSKSLLCSFLNVLIYIFIAISIIGFSQGFVIPVELYMSDQSGTFIFNILTFHFLLYFLAMIMSLYPTYFFALLFERRQGKYYRSDRLGLISYNYDNPQENIVSADYKKLELTEKLVRKFLGVALFPVWSWLIVYVYSKHQLNSGLEIALVFINLICTLIFLYCFWFYNVKVKADIHNPEIDSEKYEQQISSINKYFSSTLLISLFALCAYVGLKNWSFITIVIQLGICLVTSIHLIIFRAFRKRNPKFAEIVDLLAHFRKFGIVAFLYLVAINASSTIAENSNPINIILLYLIAFYTIAIILVKIYLFLKIKNKSSSGIKYFNSISFCYLNIKLRGYKFLIFGGLIYFIYASTHGNNFHRLELVGYHNKVSFEEFYNSFKRQYKHQLKIDSTHQPILYSAYGGGLKAHYWNFLILEELNKAERFDDILAMSGVSGGGMGIGNYTATEYLKKSSENKEKLITSIKSSNILGIELSWLFGYDLWRSFIPERFPVGKDRSHRSMQFYTNKLGSPELLSSISFYDVHAQLFKENKYYPNIIINSTSTKNQYGVISAVSKESTFPGAIDLLNFKQKSNSLSLSYFEALSTCNRFPLISPAANIPTKGHFLDGGYFENSGILSLLSFKNEIERHENQDTSITSSIFSNKIKLVSVRNDKFNYLNSLLASANIDELNIHNNHLSKNDNLTEFEAIIGGIGSLERLPFYIKDVLEEFNDDTFEFINIDLPYYIKEKDIKACFQGDIDPALLHGIQEIVTNSNNEIIKILNDNANEYDFKSWGIIDPPTARILSKPVEIYMKEMMKHSFFQDQLGALKTSTSN